MERISKRMSLSADRYFGPDQLQTRIARKLYQSVVQLPLICPHTHVSPRVFAIPDYSFGTPVDLLIIPDHYVYRMLYSQGIPMESLGVPRSGNATGPLESDHRRIWQVFADNFFLFRLTPTGQWINQELHDVFHVEENLTSESAQRIYDLLVSLLAKAEFRPRALFHRFNIEILFTTDAATDPLEDHAAIMASHWNGAIRPTFRPDAVLNLESHRWRELIGALAAASGIDIVSYPSLIRALEDRRSFFKKMGAKATDLSVTTAFTAEISSSEAEAIFQRALKGQASANDASRFMGNMLMEMARMSVEDGLVMQLHIGSLRNHNEYIHENFGSNRGADIPIAGEFTRNLRPLLNKYGNNPGLTLVLFTLDESTFGRELGPLAGHYPALKLGPPWWFYDSPNGVSRYLDEVIEISGLYNTVGFNDDARAFCSIPARHDVWRRVSANWLAGHVARHVVGMSDALEMIQAMAYGLARKAYSL
jgi:glucuronate isomerase